MDFLARLVAFVLLFLAGTAMSSAPSNASTTRHLRGPMWKEGDMLLTGPHLKWTSERGEIRVNGQPFHLKGIAWYGMETRDRCGPERIDSHGQTTSLTDSGALPIA